jgi:hypothetical protein
MDEPTPQLEPSELYNKRKSKDAARLRAYNKILDQIYNRIRVMSRLPNSQCYLMYTVPPFILGLPKIDLEDCIVYLIYQLRHSSYEVRYTYPNLIYISWVHHEKNYLIEQSPIMQAMLESADRVAAENERREREAERLLGTKKKSQRKVRAQEPGWSESAVGVGRAPSRAALNTVLGGAGGGAGSSNRPVAGPPPPSAAEYTPPSSFLQSMNNPANSQQSHAKSLPEYFNR